jgi:sugar transferase EpsL
MKRLMDIIIILCALPLLFPVFVILYVLIAIKMGRPVLFVQTRPGKDGKAFNMVKFRSMTDERDEQGELLADDVRLTRFGKFLRGTSLDELPELWNVLKGEMSLVGPRPLLMQYLELYTPEQSRRHEVRPGVTGWAQINGRNAISWTQKFSLDIWYVENQSLLLDVKILFLTILKVIRRDDISQQDHVTIEPFKGEQD